MIVSIANYFKHRDHPRNLIGETPKILKDFNLQFDKDIDIENSPILKGLEMFSEKGELETLINAVKNWREKIWTEK
ncbi:hypothetical protein [Marinifilum fragile]|uniref:hypothetical protein n=1 Tax=Marinifilum fragile TaxID=570161 RepID=UPI002AA910A2|nr:hypothetical protein [Marinifilum fragile]